MTGLATWPARPAVDSTPASVPSWTSCAPCWPIRPPGPSRATSWKTGSSLAIAGEPAIQPGSPPGAPKPARRGRRLAVIAAAIAAAVAVVVGVALGVTGHQTSSPQFHAALAATNLAPAHPGPRTDPDRRRMEDPASCQRSDAASTTAATTRRGSRIRRQTRRDRHVGPRVQPSSCGPGSPPEDFPHVDHHRTGGQRQPGFLG